MIYIIYLLGMPELTAHEIKQIYTHPKFLHILNVSMSDIWLHLKFSTSNMSPHLKFLHMTQKFSTDNVRGVRNKYEVCSHSPSHPLTKVRYRAARAAKNGINLLQIVSLQNSGYDKDIVIIMYLSLQWSTCDIMALKVAKEHTRCRKVGEESLNIWHTGHNFL